MAKRWGIFVSFLIVLSSALADSPAPPMPYVTASLWGHYSFHMIPKFADRHHGDLGYGIAYQLQPTGELKELWRTEGWYSFQVFLSHDGHHLVRMGPWNVGSWPEADDLAVAFYADGKLLKSYSTADLVKDHSKVRVSTSHYTWQAGRPGLGEAPAEEPYPFLDWDNRFHLKTIDGIVYIFDLTTGAIASQGSAATGWATAEEIDRLTIALALATEPFPFPELARMIGLPPKAQVVSSSYGQTRTERYAITPHANNQGYYVLEVDTRASGDGLEGMSKPPAGNITSLRMLYVTPDARELPILPRESLRPTIEELKETPRKSDDTPRSLSERAMKELADERLRWR